MDRELQRTRRFFGYAADRIATITECDVMSVLAVLYAIDFVGAGGEGGLGGEGRKTARALPCQGVLGSGRWHARDGVQWWQALLQAIGQQRGTMAALEPSVIAAVGKSGLVDVDAVWALTYRVFEYAQRLHSSQEKLEGFFESGSDKLPPAGFQGERLHDFFRFAGTLDQWMTTQDAVDALDKDKEKVFAAHPADTSSFGVMPFGQIWWFNHGKKVAYPEKADGLSPAWVVHSYEAPAEHAVYRWRDKEWIDK